MDPWMTCPSLSHGLQRQVSEQHLERAREREDRERQALKHLWNKEKSQYSAVASPWVKQKLRQLIKRKKKQNLSAISSVPSGFRELAPIHDLNFQHHQQNSVTSEKYREKQLQRAASDPILEVKLRRYMSSRKTSFHDKSSAPPIDSCSRTPVSVHSSPSIQSDIGSVVWDYSLKLSDMAERTLNSARMENNPIVTPSHVYMSPGQETVVGAFPIIGEPNIQPIFFLSSTPVVTSHHTPDSPATYQHHFFPHRGQQLSLGEQDQAMEDNVHLMVREHSPLTKVRSLPVNRAYSSRWPESYWSIPEARGHQLSPGQRDQAMEDWMGKGHLMVNQHRPLTKVRSLPYSIPWPESYWCIQEPRGHQLSPGQQIQEAKEWLDKPTKRHCGRVRFQDDDSLKTSVEVSIPSEQQWSSQRSSKKDETTSYTPSSSLLQRRSTHPFSRTLSTPLLYLHDKTEPPTVRADNCNTGLVCDYICGHRRPPPEHATNVWSRLQECGLSNQCKWIPGRKAIADEIQAVLGKHTFPYGTNPLGRLNLAAVRMAVGSVMELALHVIQGELRNGFAIVKPHEHVASQSESVSFLSSVAITAKLLQQRLNDKRILIVNWDGHHDNLAQNFFYENPKVLYISLHRYDVKINSGRGGPEEVGEGNGEGFNVNVTWRGELDYPIGDAEYLAAFRTVVIPIAREFSPDIILVSSKFNAVDGHPASLGGHTVSPKCFGLLTQKLMNLAHGHVVLVLEGGHDLTAICDASEACINALLEHEVVWLPKDVLMKKPCENAVHSLQDVLHTQSKYWSSVTALIHTVSQSWLQAERRYSTDSDAASALASLSMTGPNTTRRFNSETQFWRCIQNEPMEHDENESLQLIS